MSQPNPASSLEKPTFCSIPPNTLTNDELTQKSLILQERLMGITKRFSDVRFATSLAAEDMALTDVIGKSGVKIKFFTLETGRLHQETL